MSTRDIGFVTSLGADTVIDYRTQRFEDHVRDVDVVVDLVGGDTQTRSWHVLRSGGVLVGIVGPPDPERAAARGARGVFFVVEPDRTQLEKITQLIDSGRLRPMVDRVVPLPRAREAYEALEKEHPRGKVVIEIAPG